MNRLIVVLSTILVLMLSSGCSQTDESIDVNGIDRNYDAYLPASGSYALIIALHGGGDTVSSFEDYTKLTDAQQQSNDSFGVVYLEGEDKHWNDGRSESGSTADDIDFINKIIDKYAAEGANRFYVVGMSNGGLMAQRAACALANKIDGIAVVAAIQSSYLRDNCVDNNTPVKSMFVFGDSDPIFSSTTTDGKNFEIKPNRGTHIGIVATINYWQQRNCGGNSISLTQSIDTVNDGTAIDQYDSGVCNAAIRYYQVQSGGHRWPDLSAGNGAIVTSFAGTASQEVSTAEEIISFFGL